MVNRLSRAQRARILRLLVEGNSMRSITRIERVGINTVARLLCDAGEVCQDYHNRHVRGLTCTDIQADEIWSYIYAYDRNLDEDQADSDRGGCWTWTALASDSKLMICWLVGGRDLESAILFMRDLKSRVVTHTQLNSDSYPAYGEAVYLSFGPHVDYGQVTKQFRGQRQQQDGEKAVDSDLKTVIGNPDRRKISTSYVERMNLSIRMAVRRFGRRTNAFSKKIDRHEHALALYFTYYNFCQVHSATGRTPAMVEGLAREPYDLEWVVRMIEARSPARGKHRTAPPF